MYKSFVRPHLEYCSPAWSPHYQKDKELLQRVQHRFTRMFRHLRQLDYCTRLDIWSLEERRNRADLIKVFNIMTGFSSISVDAFFEVNKDGTRGHTLKLANIGRTKTCATISSVSELWTDEISWTKILLKHRHWIHSRTDWQNYVVWGWASLWTSVCIALWLDQVLHLVQPHQVYDEVYKITRHRFQLRKRRKLARV